MRGVLEEGRLQQVVPSLQAARVLTFQRTASARPLPTGLLTEKPVLKTWNSRWPPGTARESPFNAWHMQCRSLLPHLTKSSERPEPWQRLLTSRRQSCCQFLGFRRGREQPPKSKAKISLTNEMEFPELLGLARPNSDCSDGLLKWQHPLRAAKLLRAKLNQTKPYYTELPLLQRFNRNDTGKAFVAQALISSQMNQS